VFGSGRVSCMSPREDDAAERLEAAGQRSEARVERSEAAAERDQRIPEPPWWTSEQRRSARSALSREAIVEAALRVLDRHGLDGLSMRRVAAELDTGAASLYWHVANKDQLLNVLLDRVIGQIPLPEPDPERWRYQIRQFARDGRAAFGRHRDLARASMGRIPIGPNLLRAVEWQLTLLTAAGIPARPAAWFGDLFALYVTAHAFEATVAQDADEEAAAMTDYLSALPPERFPHLMAAAGELMSGDADQRFEFGLDLLIEGLTATASEHDAGPDR
jgi:AcrR family transcriptional regulator